MFKVTTAVVLLLISVTVLGGYSTAWAIGDNPLSKQFLDDARAAEAKVQTGQTALQNKEAWGEAEVCAYLRDAVWMVYSALDAYSFDNRDVPDDLHTLVNDGYISAWPLNPLHNWEPISVLTAADAFSPGDFIVQWAPISHQSIVGRIEDYKLRPLSYEIAVYGWTAEQQASGRAAPVAENTWAVAPRGVVIMFGTATETATQTLDKMRKRIQRQKQEAGQ
jgi:hypothetical protein